MEGSVRRAMGVRSHNWGESGDGKTGSDVSSFCHGISHNGRNSKLVNVTLRLLKHGESELLRRWCCERCKGEATVVVGTKRRFELCWFPI